MSLPASDTEYLAQRGWNYEVIVDSNMTCIIVKSYLLPAGYDRPMSDLLLRLSAGYPDVAPDMWWFNPGIKLADGRIVQATEVVEPHLGRTWQRWSRHFQVAQWQSGIDGLESFFALIGRELQKRVLEPVG